MSTRASIEDWARSGGGRCHDLTSSYQVECEGAFFGSTTTTLWLEFDESNVLVGLHGILKYPDSAPALVAYEQTRDALRAQAKAGYQEDGDPVDRVVAGELLAQAAVRSTFQNLSAAARLTKMADGFAVTQDFSLF